VIKKIKKDPDFNIIETILTPFAKKVWKGILVQIIKLYLQCLFIKCKHIKKKRYESLIEKLDEDSSILRE
jgi:hypothetical protein